MSRRRDPRDRTAPGGPRGADVCPHVQDLIPGYLQGRLGPMDAGAVEEHVARCPACRQDLETSREVGGALRDSLDLPEPPEGFADAVGGRLDDS